MNLEKSNERERERKDRGRDFWGMWHFHAKTGKVIGKPR